jgi:type IV pilus assembly protein PilM
MSLTRFYKLFPVPKYLELSTVGIDISDESIKFAELKYSSRGYRLGRFGEVNLPAGAVVSGKIVNREVLIEVLRQIKQKNNFDYIYASLPEEETFVVRMTIPQIKRSELRGSVELLLEEYIPLSVDQVIFDYEIYSEPESPVGHYVLGVFVAPKNLVADYTSALEESGFKLVGLEIEVQSMARALVPAGDSKTYMIIDIGKTHVGFSIVSRGVVLFSSSIKNIGGENLTKAIQKALDVSYEEAERLKKEKGLLYSPENKKIFDALIPVVSTFKDEMNRHYIYWQNMRENHEVGAGISKILFCGGQATLPGLTDYASVDIGSPVEMGNPWASFLDASKEVPVLDFNNALRYATAIGLALRGVNRELL